MQCKICNTECTGSTCSGACRAKLSRNNARALDRAQDKARALAVPGDPDYNGCCELVDGQWRVKGSGPCTELILDDQPDLDSLPAGVSKPTGLRTLKTADMSTQSLDAAVRAYRGLEWKDSPEYAETIFRLQTKSVAELIEAGQWTPAWKESA